MLLTPKEAIIRSRGQTSFHKRQREQIRKERNQEKLARRQQRKTGKELTTSDPALAIEPTQNPWETSDDVSASSASQPD